MFFRNFKISVTVYFFILQMVGMLLISAVVLFLWQRAEVRIIADQTRENLEIISRNIVTLCQNSDELEEFISGVSLAAYDWKSFYSIGPGGMQKKAPEGVASFLRDVVKRKDELEVYRGKSFSLFNIQPKLLHLGRPVPACENIEAIGYEIDITSLFSDKNTGISVILIYICVNGVILTAVWFFRMRKSVYKPLDSLVNMTERHGAYGPESVFLLSEKNAFGRLAEAIRFMFAKIERDNEKLSTMVEELRNANIEIIESQKKLIETEKFAAVGRLSAGLAHEIGNPLGIVQGYVELLQQDTLSQKDREEFSERALSELDRVNGLIRQLLNFSRKEVEDDSPSRPVEIINDLLKMIHHQKDVRDVDIIFDSRCGDAAVGCPRHKLHQVLLNCLLNSVDAVREYDHGQARIEIRCEMQPDAGENLLIIIDDNGTGVQEEDLTMVFEPFYTTKKIGKGTGLGMSVSRSIIESCRGNIRIERRDEGGTRVAISLPVVQQPS